VVIQEAICRDALQSLVQLVTDGKPKAQVSCLTAAWQSMTEREWSQWSLDHCFIGMNGTKSSGTVVVV
jgi:hypothetical protein